MSPITKWCQWIIHLAEAAKIEKEAEYKFILDASSLCLTSTINAKHQSFRRNP